MGSKTMLSLASMMLLSLSLSVVEAHFKWEENSSKCKSIFILAGQSNMAGRGYEPPTQECQPNDSILRLSANLTWELARDPLHWDIDLGKDCRVGPGMPFANKVLAANPNEVLALVPCAIGGTKISQWARGQVLYNAMIARSKAALALGGGKIEALVWFQGESDTETLEDAQNYRGRFEKFVADVRADLELPSLKVVMVVISTAPQNTTIENVKIVREAQYAISLKDFVHVDSINMPTNGDGVHFNTAGEVQIGQKLATAYIGMTKSSSGTSASPQGLGLEASAGVSVEAAAGGLIGIKGEATVKVASQGNGGY